MVKNVLGNCALGNVHTYVNKELSEDVRIICMELENDYKVWKEVEDFWRKNVNKDTEELIDTLAIKIKNVYCVGKNISYSECKQISTNWIDYMNEEYDR